MITSDPGKAARELETWAGQLEQRAQRFTDLHQRMSGLAVTESTPDGSVRVTVDGNGLPTELTLTERSRGVAPEKLSADLMACLRKAQLALRQQVEALTTETVGDDPSGGVIVAQYAERFPEDTPGTSHTQTRRIGDIDEDH